MKESNRNYFVYNRRDNLNREKEKKNKEYI